MAALPQLGRVPPSDEDHQGQPGAVTGVALRLSSLQHAASPLVPTPSPSETKPRGKKLRWQQLTARGAAHIKLTSALHVC